MYKGDENEENSIELLEPSPTPSSPFVSRFSRFARVATVPHRLGEFVESRTDVNSYMSTFACTAPTTEIDVVVLWKIHPLKYPLLSSLALDLIAIPATSAAVEWIFIQARLATAGRKCNTGPCLLKSECLMKYNRRYIVRTKSCWIVRR